MKTNTKEKQIAQGAKRIRKTGIDIIGHAPWGTHFCQFYQTKEDLIDILIPYFKAGLENNEFCMWVTSEPLSEEEAKKEMRKAVPNFDQHLRSGQIEIVPHTEWYLKDGAFDLQRVLNTWIDKLGFALTKGYDGIRVTGNTAWLEKRDWKNFTDYEEQIDSVIGKYRMMSICSYSLDKCGASELIDVVKNHQFALIRREGEWEVIESSERKRAEEALRESDDRFRQFFESEPEYCYMISPDGIILDVNNAALKVLGYKKNELVGKQLETIYAPESLPKMKQLFQKWKATGELKDEEMVIITNKGDRLTVLLSAGVVKDKDGKTLYSVSVQKDITERKRSEEEIRKKNEELEAFVYMVSHDLKNPVVSIQGFCSSILKNQRDELNEKTLFYLQRVQANASLMSSLLEDLLALSRIGRIEDKKTEISAQGVIKSVWAGVSTSLATQDVEFVCPENLPQVLYSEKRLYQIFSNLLSNALKFRDEDRKTKVEIGHQEDKDNYTFFVRDNGIGIEQKYHNKIFESFSQLKDTKSEGTGMGLAIVKKIVEANQGKVWVESQKGTGSTFYFTIPKK